MRILVHDYAGHPFQVQLARALAARGNVVLHLHAAGIQTPKGPLERRSDDPPTFEVEGLQIGDPNRKYSLVRRLRQDRRYGSLIADRAAAFGPDVVLSANAPLDAQAAIQTQTEDAGAAFVFWVQDIYSAAVARVMKQRLPGVGGIVVARFARLERRLLARSDRVVAITADFVPLLTAWGVRPSRVSVIENWAPLGDVRPLPKSNAWAVEHGLTDGFVFLYAGTLGMKHDPAILLRLAAELPSAKVVVISEGLGADWLRARAETQPNLVLLPFQPFDRLSEVLGSADVVLAILESDAGSFSVPSKVLTYLAAGRPILGAIPAENLAAKTIKRANAGLIVDPGDTVGFAEAGGKLASDREGCIKIGAAARAYAEAAFNIDDIGDRFEAVLREAVFDRTGGWPSPSETVPATRPRWPEVTQ